MLHLGWGFFSVCTGVQHRLCAVLTATHLTTACGSNNMAACLGYVTSTHSRHSAHCVICHSLLVSLSFSFPLQAVYFYF